MNSTFYSGLQALNVKGVPHEWPPSTYRWCSQWLRAGPGPHGWCLWQQDWCAWHGRSHAVERPGLGDARRGQHAASARALGHLLRSRGVPGNCVIFFFGGWLVCWIPGCWGVVSCWGVFLVVKFGVRKRRQSQLIHRLRPGVFAAKFTKKKTKRAARCQESRLVIFGGWANKWLDDVWQINVSSIVGPPYAITKVEPPLGPVTGQMKVTIYGVGFQSTNGMATWWRMGRGNESEFI